MEIFIPKFTLLRKICFLISIAWLISSSLGYAQTLAPVKGEIININHHLNIAFSDIGGLELKPGDFLQIKLHDGSKTYLEVFETSKILSKLGLSSHDDIQYKTRPADFMKIRVGDPVQKIVIERTPSIPQEPAHAPMPLKRVEREKQQEAAVIQSEDEAEAPVEERIDIRAQIDDVKKDMASSVESIEKLKSKNEALRNKIQEMELEIQMCDAEEKECIKQLEQLEVEVKDLMENWSKIESRVDEAVGSYGN